jgi:hypothetical protein
MLAVPRGAGRVLVFGTLCRLWHGECRQQRQGQQLMCTLATCGAFHGHPENANFQS